MLKMADHYVITITEKGGPGSGHHGHAGVPGQLGGSAPGGGVGFGISVATSGGFTRADEGCEIIIDCAGVETVEKSYAPWVEECFANGTSDGLNDYTIQGSYVLNRDLREGQEPAGFHAEVMQDMDTALEDSQVPEDMIVYRAGNLPEGVEVGDSFTDNAFVSTTLMQSYAAEYAAEHRSAVFEIRLPQGTQAGYVKKMSGFPKEAEIIINRGSSFSVVGVNTDGNFILEVQQ